MLQKKSGRTNGWISYTWSKSLRKYDERGNIINAAMEFYDNNDCRNNFNITVAHRFNEKWDVSASWTYRTGRRGSIANMVVYSSFIDEYNAIYKYSDGFLSPDLIPEEPDGAAYFFRQLRTYTYRERNGYRMPDIHHLDVAVNYTIKHKHGQSKIGLSIYNLYNRKNVSSLYIGHENDELALKGICPLPCIPSIQYTFSF